MNLHYLENSNGTHRMPRDKYRDFKRKIEKENKKFSNRLEKIPSDDLPDHTDDTMLDAYRSAEYLVQVFDVSDLMPGLIQISVQRMMINRNGEFADGIPFDDLQIIKNEVGFSNYDAVEILPRHIDYYTKPNVRYIWVLTKSTLPFIWRRDPSIRCSDNK